MRLDAGSMSDLCASVCILIDSVIFYCDDQDFVFVSIFFGFGLV